MVTTRIETGSFPGREARPAPRSILIDLTPPLEPLESAADDLWPASGALIGSSIGRAVCVEDGSRLAVTLSIEAVGGDRLEELSRAAYLELLGAMRERDYPHLWRIWNVVPRINADSRGLERYKLFCRGRSLALSEVWGDEGLIQNVCAATAVGGEGDSLWILALAARTPGRHIENPRQVPAYYYPEQYGPKSPSFARATIGAAHLFVSGTASIVGHESKHLEDPMAQLHEALDNIEAVIEAAGSDAARIESLRAYVRNADDWPRLKDGLQQRHPAARLTAYRAEICRTELLVEVEALASVR